MTGRMMVLRSCRSWIINTNPFYLISVGLVLYGIQVSFADTRLVGADWAWILMKVLGGYTLALTLVAVLIIKVGRVWDDARTILLLLILLLVALASSFDRACLDDVRQSAKLLLWGWAFAISLCELVIRFLPLSVSARFRAATYGQLGLLFVYPVVLGSLSLNGQDERMALGVIVFPALAGVSLLGALPAAMRGDRDQAFCPPGWKWPIYPFAAFFIIAAGLALRSWGLTYSFELALGMDSGFARYQLIPILAAVIVVGLELMRHTRRSSMNYLVVLTPALLLPMAFPLEALTDPQLASLGRFREFCGSPIQLAVVLASVIYVRWYAAGYRSATWGLFVMVGCASIIDRHTVDWSTLAAIQQLPLGVLIFGLAARSTWTGRAGPMVASHLLAIGDVLHLANHAYLDAHIGYVALHAALITLLTVPLGYQGRLAQWVRHYGTHTAAGVAVLAGTIYPLLFSRLPGVVHLGLIGILFGIASVRWLIERRLDQVDHAAICLLSAAFRSFVEALAYYRKAGELVGRDWLVAGVVLLMVALTISLAKGGIRDRGTRWLRQLHTALGGMR